MQNGSDTRSATSHGSTNVPHIDDATQALDAIPTTTEERSPLLLCIVVGGEPAFEFASLHGLPVRTYCGAWIYHDVVHEAAAAVGDGVDCPACDLELLEA